MSSPTVPYGPDRYSSNGSSTSLHRQGSSGGSKRASNDAQTRLRVTTQHHPRVLAALCYTVPVVPAWMLLARSGGRRESPFVRFHAAQSLVFQTVVGLCQVLLYALLVVLGGIVSNIELASVIALLLLALYLAQAAIVVFTWSSLMADCIRGDARVLPVLGPLAIRLERFAPRTTWARWRARVTGAA